MYPVHTCLLVCCKETILSRRHLRRSRQTVLSPSHTLRFSVRNNVLLALLIWSLSFKKFVINEVTWRSKHTSYRIYRFYYYYFTTTLFLYHKASQLVLKPVWLFKTTWYYLHMYSLGVLVWWLDQIVSADLSPTINLSYLSLCVCLLSYVLSLNSF